MRLCPRSLASSIPVLGLGFFFVSLASSLVSSTLPLIKMIRLPKIEKVTVKKANTNNYELYHKLNMKTNGNETIAVLKLTELILNE